MNSFSQSQQMNNFNYDQFITEMTSAFLQHKESQRYGQFMMNYLYRYYPDIVIPEHCDCFYDNNKSASLLVHLYNTNRDT